MVGFLSGAASACFVLSPSLRRRLLRAFAATAADLAQEEPRFVREVHTESLTMVCVSTEVNLGRPEPTQGGSQTSDSLTLQTITLRLGELSITVATSGSSSQTAGSSHGVGLTPSQADATSASASTAAPAVSTTGSGVGPAPAGDDPWAHRLAAAQRAGAFAKELLGGGFPSKWEKHPAAVSSLRPVIHVVLQGQPGVELPAGYVTTAGSRKAWVGEPAADSSIFHSWPSLKEAQCYYNAAGFTGKLEARSDTEVQKAIQAFRSSQ